ncbi:MAG: Txe/YoeB family addiction module toxin [Bacteroidota bacterium]
MIIQFTAHAWEDFTYLMENEPEAAIRVKELLKSITQTPFTGIGKPEPLKYDLKGFWSRRITGEYRLVYQVSGQRGVDQKCAIVQCRFHYDGK